LLLITFIFQRIEKNRDIERESESILAQYINEIDELIDKGLTSFA
jgi:hypothetical protein